MELFSSQSQAQRCSLANTKKLDMKANKFITAEYKYTALPLSINSDFWDNLLVHQFYMLSEPRGLKFETFSHNIKKQRKKILWPPPKTTLKTKIA
jgi:hypothetical protein